MTKMLLPVLMFIILTIVCQIHSAEVPAEHQVRDDLITKKHDDSTTEQEIRLEDFFWTGSGDGPPEYLKKIHGLARNGKEVIVKTETIIATVYLEGQNELNPLCLDCDRESESLPHNYSTSDRRFWLLTVVAGFLRPSDILALENNLAKLYRVAFTRQQSQHFGIVQNVTDFSYLNNRKRRAVSANETTLMNPAANNSLKTENTTARSAPIQTKQRKDIRVDPRSKSTQPKTITTDSDIRVLIHNVSLITEKDLENPDTFYNDPTDIRNLRPLANQTEIIYTVFIGGNPVLATAAASDMKLVSENEVAIVMGKEVFMKAEPYLKEPQATPLVPATKTHAGAVNIYNVMQNPIVIVVCSIVILLLLILIIALLLMARAKRRRSAEVKRLSSRQALLSDPQGSSRVDPSMPSEIATTGRTDPGDGIDNEGFTHDKNLYGHAHERTRTVASIHFPEAPHDTASTSTSDSSVYCPINQPKSLQNMLDEKAASLFEKKRKGSQTSINKEATYATIGKKRSKKTTKSRHKRKYLGENRVGSIEEENTRSSRTSFSSDSVSDTFRPDEQYDTTEAYNAHVKGNYHRNKILQNRIFTDRAYVHESTNEPMTSPTQAINREILKASHFGDKTSESGSVGSYLSMASVKSFPRSALPEPLNRVLEPVSVTYYDQYDDSESPQRQIKRVKPLPRSDKDFGVREKKDTHDPLAISSTQSDAPDPGVIGPIVWEIHKKRLAADRNDSIESPIHDPAITRNRFEGLLEGAIQMYTNNPNDITNDNQLVETNDNDNVRRLPEIRGKSAVVLGNSQRGSKLGPDSRPLTAGALKSSPSNNSTQPPTPRDRAWGSGAPSPLVRPLSAGPFHRPEAPVVDVTRILASQTTDKAQLSAAPLIEAIQNELKKFKRENS